jgi:hypothetical protein
LAYYNQRNKHKSAIDDILQSASDGHVIAAQQQVEVSDRVCVRSPIDDAMDVLPPVHVDADNVVRDYVGGIFLHHSNDTINTPPLTPPATKPPTLPTTIATSPPPPTPATKPPPIPTPATTPSSIPQPATTPPLLPTPATTTTPLPTPATTPLTLAPPITIRQSCPASGVQDSARRVGTPTTYDFPSGLSREDECSSYGSEEVHSDVENALLGCLSALASML